MRAKEKAEELIEKFGIEKAILCVDDIIELFWKTHKNEDGFRFYQQVKQEILNRQ